MSPETQAARILNLDPLLLEAVCQWETRGERTRGTADRALGDHRQAVGRCQVQIGTAAYLLGLLEEHLTPEARAAIRLMLHERLLNAYFAARELAWCVENRPTAERAVACYQGGRWSRWRGPTLGTKNVLVRYAAAKLEETP